MLVTTLFLLCVGLAAATKPLEGVKPSTLSCSSHGYLYLLLPHCSDCTKFYMCLNGIPLQFSCSTGLIFDFELQSCTWPWIATCQLGNAACHESSSSEESQEVSSSSSSEETEAPIVVTTPAPEDTSEENSSEESAETTPGPVETTPVPESSEEDNSETTTEPETTTPETIETTPVPDSSEEVSETTTEPEAVETTPVPDSSEEVSETTTEPETVETTPVPETSEEIIPESEEGSGLEGSGLGEVEWTEGSGEASDEDEVVTEDPSAVAPAEVASLPIQPIASDEVDDIIAEHFTPSNLDCSDPASANRAVAYEGNCQRYWRCVNGIAESQYCVDGMFFNERSQQCDFESNVVCNSRNSELTDEFILVV